MKRLAVLLLPLATLFLLSCAPDPGPPNFVWIISEDNSKHYLELFDEDGIETPNIAALADQGVLFTHAFSNGAVCSVARSTLISGCYAPRTGTQYHRKIRMVPMPDGVEMFPAYLRRAGYYTTNNSKTDYNYEMQEGVWDESSQKAHWRNRDGDQPFFHKASYGISHESQLHFDAGLMDRYSPVTDPSRVHVFPVHPDTELFRFTGALYRDRILSVDSIVGQVVAQLEADGLLESTFIFYFGDHGGVLPGSKGYAYESGLHVPLVVRVPEKFRHLVDFEQGASSGAFVSFVDLGPTVLELAGAGLPGGIDGKPFLGAGIPSEEVAHWDEAFGYADRFDEKYDMVRTLRKGSLKYMRSYQPFNFDGLQNNYRYKCLAFQEWRSLHAQGKLNEVQSAFFEPRAPEALYDLDSDPYETTNLAGNPAYADDVEEMRHLLGTRVRDLPDLSFYPESVMLQEGLDNPVSFGQERKAHIARLADVADLSLLPFPEARGPLGQALQSADPMELYWALIACSSFGEEAKGFEKQIRKLTRHEHLLVRTRAAEFLGLTGLADPMPVLTRALGESSDPVEVLLMLNTLVLLRDGPWKYPLDVHLLQLQEGPAGDQQVQRRLEYLDGGAG